MTAGSDALLALYHDFLSGRMAHATLLIGEAGIGKKTLAGLLAQGLLCTGSGDRPCGQCRDCRRFAARTHPDALFPAPAPREKTIKIDALREMIDTLSRHALEGGRRVVVIENAERMTPQAQNCLLKTLEEAQEDTYFLLTADIETALLPTIRSRCRVIRMQPWSQERIAELLRGRGIPAERVHALALYCEGSPGLALQMQEDESYWAARDTVRRSFLSVESAADLPGAAQVLRDQKDAGSRLLNILEQEIRALLHEKLAGAPLEGEEAPSRWRTAPPESLLNILTAIMDARRQKNANVGWAALSEGLLQTISEEASKWQV
ncbi:MAG: DNA polymerase III subunit delta' [Clostridia bacterium]|nr:DNA polymerase III subunit delta' [Clostridia bacterium]